MNESIEQLLIETTHKLKFATNEQSAYEVLEQAINQAREADRRKIEELEKMAALHHQDWKNAEEQFTQLESKVLELTEAATEYMQSPDDDREAYRRLKSVLSTTPATEIRERIKQEGFDEGVEAVQNAIKAVESSASVNTGLEENRACQLICQSLKKGGTL